MARLLKVRRDWFCLVIAYVAGALDWRGWPSPRGVLRRVDARRQLPALGAASDYEKTRIKGWPQATGADAVVLWLPDRYGLLHLLEGGFAEDAIPADAL
jgi:hypothetical protein